MEQNQTQNPGTAGDTDGPSAGPRHGWDEIRDVRRLSRPRQERMVAGVASGVARHLDVDPLLVRIAFAVLAFFGGAGIFLYAALWLVLPDDASGRAPVPLDRRSLQVAVLGIVVLAGVVLLGGTWGGWPFPWQLLLVVGLVLFVMSRRNGRSENQQWQPVAGQPGAWPATPHPQEAPMSTPTSPAAPRGLDETAPLHGTPLFAAAPSAPAHPYDQQPVAPTVQAAVPPTAQASAQQQDWQRPAAAYPNGAQAPYGPATPMPPLPPPVKVRRPRDPRKRGPILFWITLALIALGIGIMGMVDVAGVAVADSAYPALALGVTAAMLLLGAFWGRAGGLIALGLVAALVTGTTLVGERWETDAIRIVPASAAETADQHDFKRGEFVLDLSKITDPENLDARLIRVTGGVGRIEVVVPDELDVDVTATVGVGSLRLLDGPTNEGLGLSTSYGAHAGEERPQLVLQVELGVGEVDVVRPGEATSSDTRSASALTVTEGAL